MSRAHIITADARTTSGLDFFDAITGSSPEKRAERDRLMDEQCIRAIQSGDTYGWPPVAVERCKKIMAERVVPYSPMRFRTLDDGRESVAA